MSRDKFVTGNLHRISDKIAEVAKKHEQELSQWKNPPSKKMEEEMEKDMEKGTVTEEKKVFLHTDIPEEKDSGIAPAPVSERSSENISSSASSPVPVQEESALLKELAISSRTEEKEENNPNKRRRLSDSVEAALQRHHEEALRLKRDLHMLLESTAAEVEESCKGMETYLSGLQEIRRALQEEKKEFSLLDLPNQDAADYQMRLAALYRKMDHLKIELLRQKAKAERLSGTGGTASEKENRISGINLFAEMHSLKNKDLFRTGFWMNLPLILGILIASLLIALAQILTFRVGL